MTEPREEHGDEIRPTGDVEAQRGAVLQPSRALNADPSEPKASPLRWLLVIVPLVVIALAGAFVVRSMLNRPAPVIGSSEGDRRTESARSPHPTPSEWTSIPREAERPAPEQWVFNADDVLSRLARADLQNGAATLKICAICHSVDRAGGHRLGPKLWNIVGRPKASYDDYAYSQALRLRGGRWTYEELAAYLYDTRTAVPGGKMAFAGIKSPAKLADVIAYLRTLADKPEPLPRTP